MGIVRYLTAATRDRPRPVGAGAGRHGADRPASAAACRRGQRLERHGWADPGRPASIAA